MKSKLLSICVIIISVITIGLMTESNSYATYTIEGNNLTIIAHEEINGSVVDKPIIDEYWLYTNGSIYNQRW